MKRWCQKICNKMRNSGQFEPFWRKISIMALSACLKVLQAKNIHKNVARNWSWSLAPKFEIMINILQLHLQWSWSHKRSFLVMVILIFNHKDHWSYPAMIGSGTQTVWLNASSRAWTMMKTKTQNQIRAQSTHSYFTHGLLSCCDLDD